MNRVGKILRFLGDQAVNGIDLPNDVPVPPIDPDPPALEKFTSAPNTVPHGWRDIFIAGGPEAFASAVRRHKGLLLMDTTWRDAHQSLLATRVRTYDLLKIAKQTSHAFASAFSLEMWGGATFDVSLRFLKECPWDRLRQLRALVPNIPFQMLLRGANAVGYTSYPDNVVYEFCRQARINGIDIFRIFDSLNYVENLKLGIEAVRAADGIIEAAVCYTGNIADPSKTKYTLEYYMDLVDQLVSMKIHILGIKDMAGLLTPPAATKLVSAIRARYPDLPIHVHTHDTPGSGVASMLAAAHAGADIVDAAIDCLTSQPSMGAIIGATRGTNLETGINPLHARLINDYWEQTRLVYAPFESPSLRSGNSDVYVHEMPGGQYTNLQFQAHKLGLGSQWPQIKTAYAQANQVLGDIIKVTPSSKVVGDLAQFMVQNGLDEKSVVEQAETLSFPSSVVSFLRGEIGIPHSGFPEPFRSRVLKDSPRIEGRPGVSLSPLDFNALKTKLIEKWGIGTIRDVDVVSAALYPKVFDEFADFKNRFGDVTILPTRYFFAPASIDEEISINIQKGRVLFIKLLAVGRLLSNGEREVFWEANGNARAIVVQDRCTAVAIEKRLKADPYNLGSIGAPMGGVVLEIRVKETSIVKVGDPLVILSAMKMETVVTSPVSGVVSTLHVKAGDSLDAGDLILLITQHN